MNILNNQDLKQMILFGGIAAISSLITFDLPGTSGGVQDFREIFTLLGILFVRKWMYALGIGFIASLSGPYGSGDGLIFLFNKDISDLLITIFMHITVIPCAWGLYQWKLKSLKNQFVFAFSWILLVNFLYNIGFAGTFAVSKYLLSVHSQSLTDLYFSILGFQPEVIFTTLVTTLGALLYRSHTQAKTEKELYIQTLEQEINEREKTQRLIKKSEEKSSSINADLIQEIQKRKHQQQILKGLVEATAATSGKQFYNNLVDSLARLLKMRYAFITKCVSTSPPYIATLANWADGQLKQNFEYQAFDTPCQDAIEGKISFFPEKVRQYFPVDQDLIDMEAESFIGIPFFDRTNTVIGHLVVIDDKPMTNHDELISIMKIFAVRAGVEFIRQQTEEALLKSKEEAELANLAKSDFLSHMSHEFRTPLNAILGFSQLLSFDEIEPLTTDQSESVTEIINAGEHLLVLINEILDLTKIESGKIEFNNEIISPRQIIEDCQKIAKILTKDHQLNLCECKCNIYSVNINVDKIRFKQVLLNLISNAVKYNSENGSITVECRIYDNNFYRIKIKDTGIGMTEDEMKNIFKPFNRTQKSKFIEGTGIGLSITKQLVELMGGEIGVTSQVDIGSEFWIQFPIANSVPLNNFS